MSLIGGLIPDSGSGGSGTTAWGNIIGTLSNQSDLQGALNSIKAQVKVPGDYNTVKAALDAGEDNIYIVSNVTETTNFTNNQNNIKIQIASGANWTLFEGSNTINNLYIEGAGNTSVITANRFNLTYCNIFNVKIVGVPPSSGFNTVAHIIGYALIFNTTFVAPAIDTIYFLDTYDSNHINTILEGPTNNLLGQYNFYFEKCVFDTLNSSAYSAPTNPSAGFYFDSCKIFNYNNTGSNVKLELFNNDIDSSNISANIDYMSNNKISNSIISSTTINSQINNHFVNTAYTGTAPAPTSNYFAIQSSGNLIDNINPLGKKTIPIYISDGILPSSSPAMMGSVTGNNGIVTNGVDFIWSYQTNIQFNVAMPKSWDAGTINYDVVWYDSSKNGGDVTFGLQALGASNGDNIDASFSPGVEVTQSVASSTDTIQYITSKSANLTISNTPEKEDVVYFNFYRKYSGTSSAGNVLACYVRLYINVNNANDN